MKTILIASLLLIVFPAQLSLASGSGMKPGLWDITTVMQVPGMPYQPPPTTVTHCFTKEEVDNPEQIVPSQEESCAVADLKRSGDRVSWTVNCSGENSGTGSGEIHFKGDSEYSGTMNFTAQGMSMITRLKGKRVGECR